jgi:hypothetical protein
LGVARITGRAAETLDFGKLAADGCLQPSGATSGMVRCICSSP